MPPVRKPAVALEPLEDRLAPAAIPVTTFDDVLDPGDGLTSLREAVLQANASTEDSVIQLDEGTYTLSLVGGGENAGLTGDLDVQAPGRTVTIEGAGKGTVLDAGGIDRAMDLFGSSREINATTTVILRDFTAINGLATEPLGGRLGHVTAAAGGGVRANTGVSLTLYGVRLEGNFALGAGSQNAQGAGLSFQGDNLSIANSELIANRAVGGDGAAGQAGEVGWGGGRAAGGGLYVDGGVVSLADVRVADNYAQGGAGGAGGVGRDSATGDGGKGEEGGRGGFAEGGGVYLIKGSFAATRLQVVNNTAQGGAGGAGGHAPPGVGTREGVGGSGGLGGTARGGGMGIGSASVTPGTVLQGNATLTDCELSGNAASGGTGGPGGPAAAGGPGGDSHGGGVEVDGLLSLTRAAVQGNFAVGGAGGLGGPALPDDSFPLPGGAGGAGGAATGGGVASLFGRVAMSGSLDRNRAEGGHGGRGGDGTAGGPAGLGGEGGPGGSTRGGGMFDRTVSSTPHPFTATSDPAAWKSNVAIAGAGGPGGVGAVPGLHGHAGVASVPNTPLGAGAANVGDLVWSDLDADGVLDPGEPGYPNAAVRLLDGAGATLAEATTDAAGRYFFYTTYSGKATLRFVLPAYSPRDRGSDAFDSDADPATGSTATFSLAPGVKRLTLDAGVPVPAADILDVAPDPRVTSAGRVIIAFNKPVTGLDVGDFTLTRNGLAVDLGGATLTQLSPSRYALDLSWLGARTGAYSLRLVAAGSGVASGDVPLVADATDVWKIVPPRTLNYASSVIGFSSEGSRTLWGSNRALGAPDVFRYFDDPYAWTPLQADNGFETLSVAFPVPMYADSLLIRESFSNGFVLLVELRDLEGNWHTAWTGEDTSPKGEVADFVVRFPTTPYLVDGARITIDTLRTPEEWEAIDAVQLHGLAPNNAPVLDGSAAPRLTSVLASQRAPRGDTVGSILGASVRDADGPLSARGIAVTAATAGDGLGVWQFSRDGGATYENLPAVSPSEALLLAAEDRLRFVPAGGKTGPVSLTYHGWDQSTGAAGGRADLSGPLGGNTAFSEASATGLLVVAGAALPPGGGAVAAAVSPGFRAANPGAAKGVAVDVATGLGRWQYLLLGTKAWRDFGRVSPTAALLLRAGDRVRFLPALGYGGTATLRYHAWDRSDGRVAGTKADVFGAPYSPATDWSLVVVPQARGRLKLLRAVATPLTRVTSVNTRPPGDVVGLLLGGLVGGASGDTKVGIAVTGLFGSAQGTWQFSTDGGATWRWVGPVSNTTALLLRASDVIRFVPRGRSLGVARLSFALWDQRVGAAGGYAAAVGTSFSAGRATTYVEVVP